jgi:hypothetical protein
MKTCKECKEIIHDKAYSGGLCQACYVYFKNGGTKNEIPEKGVITKDSRGFIVCHICGKAYGKLGAHIVNKHKMTADSYREQFGLNARSQLTSDEYHAYMGELAYAYDMPEQLRRVGRNTRITSDRKLRKGKPIRLQEVLNKQKRVYKKKKEENT